MSLTYDSVQLARSGLINYWKLDETSGTTAADSKGSNPGTYSGGYTLNQPGLLVPGGDNSPSVKFNGSTGQVSVPDATSLKPAAFSIEVIVEPLAVAPTSGYSFAVGKYDVGVGGFTLGMYNGLEAWLFVGFSGVGTAGKNLTLNAMNHLVLTYSGTSANMYLNGALVYGPATISNAWGTSPLTIGQSANDYWNGYIQKVSYYNRVLTPAEIATDAQIAGKAFVPERHDETIQLAGGFIDHGYQPPAGSYTIQPTDRLLRSPVQTAAVTYTLPPGNLVGVSQRFEIQDEGGTAATYNITIKDAGNNTVATLSTNNTTWMGYWNGSTWTTRMPQINVSGAVTSVNGQTGAVVLGSAPTPVKTANYSPSNHEFVPCDISAGSFTVTLPSAPTDGAEIEVKVVKINANASNTLTVTCGGTDVFDVTSGTTSMILTNDKSGVVLKYKATGGIWYVRTYLGILDGPHYVGGTNSLGTTLNAHYTLPSGYQPLFFYKDLMGLVHVEGVIQAGASTVTGETIFTLPTGYTPVTGQVLTHAATDTSGAIYNYDLGITTGGAINVLVAPASGARLGIGIPAFRTV